jgi:ubiquinone biosynthesis protein
VQLPPSLNGPAVAGAAPTAPSPDATSATATPATNLPAAAPGDDRQLGSFSEHGPWNLAQRPPTWRRAARILRREQQRRLPALTRAPRLPPVARAVTVVLVLGSAIGLWYLRDRGRERSKAELSRRLREAAERLGPTYIKLAQIISAGEGLFPDELVAECRKCRDQVPAVGFDQVRQVVESALERPVESVFASFEPEPLAAASIAQVHAATLVTGETVVVKVQRPGIDQLVRRDLKVLAWLAPFLVGRIPVAALANPPALVELFAETIIEELDFRLEADNMLDVAKVFTELGQEGFVVPRPHPELVTKRILVMERLSGYGFDDVEGMQAAGLDTEAILKTSMIGFIEGALIHGIFHGDLHGGNMFVLPDGRTALLDFGITARLTDTERLAFLRMMLTATSNDLKGQAAALRDLGFLPVDTDLDAVMRDLSLDDGPVDPTKMAPEEMVAEIQTVMKALLAYGARMPKPLMLYVKNLIFIDGAIAKLAPQLDLVATVTDIAMHMTSRHGATLASELGATASTWQLDVEGIRAQLWADPDSDDRVTYADLQAKRDLIRKRMSPDVLRSTVGHG